MQMHIQSSSLELDSVRQAEIVTYVEKRFGSLDKLIKRFESAGEVQVYIEISKPIKHHGQGKIYYAELTMRLPGQTLRAEGYAENVETAVDDVKEKVKHEITKYRDVHITRKVRMGKLFVRIQKFGK